ncbi:hypothetical protein NPIL_325191 [Nephila pilipes]|uniref:Uncharacterized protein n=1 Tax=Nephila pilipes TaxID=299642 RepID=A0A8X6MUL7_NEPPI|nr:hypothetical protein NPIL_325191 [Nephila pilipes]
MNFNNQRKFTKRWLWFPSPTFPIEINLVVLPMLFCHQFVHRNCRERSKADSIRPIRRDAAERKYFIIKECVSPCWLIFPQSKFASRLSGECIKLYYDDYLIQDEDSFELDSVLCRHRRGGMGIMGLESAKWTGEGRRSFDELPRAIIRYISEQYLGTWMGATVSCNELSSSAGYLSRLD